MTLRVGWLRHLKIFACPQRKSVARKSPGGARLMRAGVDIKTCKRRTVGGVDWYLSLEWRLDAPDSSRRPFKEVAAGHSGPFSRAFFCFLCLRRSCFYIFFARNDNKGNRISSCALLGSSFTQNTSDIFITRRCRPRRTLENKIKTKNRDATFSFLFFFSSALS